MLAWAALMVWAPARLVAEVAGAPPRLARQRIGFAALSLLGVGLALLLPTPDLEDRVALAVAGLCAVSIAYVDARWLVIPNIYSLAIALLGLIGPLRQPLLVALGGALLAGGLVWGVRLAWRRWRGVEGLGFGDVKLAAALGFLLGAENALRTVCVAAVLGAAAGLVMRHRRSAGANAGEELIPFGAALAVCGAAVLYWSRLR